MREERAGLSLAELSRRIHSGEVASSHATEEVFETIAHEDDTINSFVTLFQEQALQASEAADHMLRAGQDLGPLHGVPVNVKDIFATKGIRTTAGSKILSDWIPDEDATVITRLRQAGAVLVGKTNMHEFAFGVTTENPFYGDTRNPWDPERVPGGSSGGSGASVAAGMGYASLGTDTGGSVRIPAALCGIVGLKPTYGRVSRYGVVPLAWSLDHVGPLTRTVEDAAIVLQAIAGYDARDPASSRRSVPDYAAGLGEPVERLTIGVPADPFWDPIQPEVETAVRAAIGVIGGFDVQVVEVEFPRADLLPSLQPIILSEAAAYHHRWLQGPEAADYSPRIKTGLLQGAVMPALDYVTAQRGRAALRSDAQELFRRVDALVMPTLPVVAPKIGESRTDAGGVELETTRALTRNMSPFNLLGFPALTVPCGFDSQELPVGLQIAGRPFEEALVLRLGHAYQQVTDWHEWRPPGDTTA